MPLPASYIFQEEKKIAPNKTPIAPIKYGHNQAHLSGSMGTRMKERRCAHCSIFLGLVFLLAHDTLYILLTMGRHNGFWNHTLDNDNPYWFW